VRDLRDQQQYVMKEIDITTLGAKGRKEALKEVGFLAKLAHPAIIGYREWFEKTTQSYNQTRRVLYIVMEYADGGDLSILIKNRRGKPFPEEQIVYYMVQMALALKHMHDRKIIHRDVKAENVFLNRKNQVKIGDFGISKSLERTLAQARTRIGTPYYLSPEICMDRPYDGRNDSWALGVVLYQLCALRHPFDATSMEGLLHAIIHTKHRPLSSAYSKPLRDLVDMLLVKQQARRITIHDMLRLPYVEQHVRRFLAAGHHDPEYVELLTRSLNFGNDGPDGGPGSPGGGAAPNSGGDGSGSDGGDSAREVKSPASGGEQSPYSAQQQQQQQQQLLMLQQQQQQLLLQKQQQDAAAAASAAAAAAPRYAPRAAPQPPSVRAGGPASPALQPVAAPGGVMSPIPPARPQRGAAAVAVAPESVFAGAQAQAIAAQQQQQSDAPGGAGVSSRDAQRAEREAALARIREQNLRERALDRERRLAQQQQRPPLYGDGADVETGAAVGGAPVYQQAREQLRAQQHLQQQQQQQQQQQGRYPASPYRREGSGEPNAASGAGGASGGNDLYLSRSASRFHNAGAGVAAALGGVEGAYSANANNGSSGSSSGSYHSGGGAVPAVLPPIGSPGVARAPAQDSQLASGGGSGHGSGSGGYTPFSHYTPARAPVSQAQQARYGNYGQQQPPVPQQAYSGGRAAPLVPPRPTGAGSGISGYGSPYGGRQQYQPQAPQYQPAPQGQAGSPYGRVPAPPPGPAPGNVRRVGERSRWR
jgi:serine/threonine protein kinase